MGYAAHPQMPMSGRAHRGYAGDPEMPCQEVRVSRDRPARSLPMPVLSKGRFRER